MVRADSRGERGRSGKEGEEFCSGKKRRNNYVLGYRGKVTYIPTKLCVYLYNFGYACETYYQRRWVLRTVVTFDDVAGIDESENELVEIVDFLKDLQKYTRL